MYVLWVVLFSLLFFPESVFSVKSSFGTFTTADLFILPYIAITYLIGRRIRVGKQVTYKKIMFVIVMFLWWGTICTLLIPLRYSYSTLYETIFGLLKLAKLALYSGAAFLTIKFIRQNDKLTHYLDWAVLISLLVISIVLIVSRNDTPYSVLTIEEFREVQYGTNTTAGTMAIMIMYILGRFRFGLLGSNLNRILVIGFPIISLGFLFTDGRAAWLAVLLGMVFLFFTAGRTRYSLMLIFAVVVIVFAYRQSPNIQREINKTLYPKAVYGSAFMERYNTGGLGFDDGSRFYLWWQEGRKFFESPFLGRGFYHRGQLSGIAWYGSHNYFIQIFLETGALGGGLMLYIWYSLWQQTRLVASDDSLKFAKIGQIILLTSVVLAMTGEYFYGGLTWFIFLITMGSVFQEDLSFSHERERSVSYAMIKPT